MIAKDPELNTSPTLRGAGKSTVGKLHRRTMRGLFSEYCLFSLIVAAFPVPIVTTVMQREDPMNVYDDSIATVLVGAWWFASTFVVAVFPGALMAGRRAVRRCIRDYNAGRPAALCPAADSPRLEKRPGAAARASARISRRCYAEYVMMSGLTGLLVPAVDWVHTWSIDRGPYWPIAIAFVFIGPVYYAIFASLVAALPGSLLALWRYLSS